MHVMVVLYSLNMPASPDNIRGKLRNLFSTQFWDKYGIVYLSRAFIAVMLGVQSQDVVQLEDRMKF